MIVEGDFDAVEMPDVMFYLDLSDEQRLKNRIARDTVTRNESEESIRKNFEQRQLTQHLVYTIKAKEKADYVISGRADAKECFVYEIIRNSIKNQKI